MTPQVIQKDQDFYEKSKKRIFGLPRRELMTFFMVLSDFLCMSASVGLAIWGWSHVRSDLLVDVYQSLILPITGLFLCIYLLTGMYPGIGIGPVEELRRLTLSTSLGMLGLMGLSFYLRNITSWSRAVLGIT